MTTQSRHMRLTSKCLVFLAASTMPGILNAAETPTTFDNPSLIKQIKAKVAALNSPAFVQFWDESSAQISCRSPQRALASTCSVSFVDTNAQETQTVHITYLPADSVNDLATSTILEIRLDLN